MNDINPMFLGTEAEWKHIEPVSISSISEIIDDIRANVHTY